MRFRNWTEGVVMMLYAARCQISLWISTGKPANLGKFMMFMLVCDDVLLGLALVKWRVENSLGL
jgi:hypothetical protein